MKAGYTKSVDLWSLGCVTVVLLIGTPPFPFSASGDMDYIEPGDLNEVFMNTRWSEASTMAQNFVLSLLVLDERKRLTAKQALQHSWFMNEQYHSKLEQLYEEAISDWRPGNRTLSPKSGNCLRSGHIDSDKAPRTALTPTPRPPKYQVVTTLFEERVAIEAGRKSNFVKATYPTRGRNMHERAPRDNICVLQSSTPSPNTRRSFSPQAWKTTPSDRKIAAPDKPDFNQLNLDFGTLKRPKADLTMAQKSWEYTSRKLNGRFNMPAGMPAVTSKAISGTKRRFDETQSPSPEIGEVYEEIENKITGKVQRFLYQEK